MTKNEHSPLALPEHDILTALRKSKPAHKKISPKGITVGEKIADRVAATVGSWAFIITQSVILVFWITANIFAWVNAWDPYPFILLNLMLSFQAAYAAPIIMMAQNRQADIDRKKAEKDYDVNLKAELEIELLHQKIDLLREQEIKKLTSLLERILSERHEDR